VTREELNALTPGVYRFRLHDGGCHLAAVGVGAAVNDGPAWRWVKAVGWAGVWSGESIAAADLILAQDDAGRLTDTQALALAVLAGRAPDDGLLDKLVEERVAERTAGAQGRAFVPRAELEHVVRLLAGRDASPVHPEDLKGLARHQVDRVVEAIGPDPAVLDAIRAAGGEFTTPGRLPGWFTCAGCGRSRWQEDLAGGVWVTRTPERTTAGDVIIPAGREHVLVCRTCAGPAGPGA
jgi:hypothetical protein